VNETSKSTRQLVWGGLVAVILAICIAFVWSSLSGLKEARQPDLPVYGQVTGFSLTNQLGETVTVDSLSGEPWVADLIFTRCPGPCARLTRRMSELQQALPRDEGVRLVSITADPEYDSPEVLRTYAERFGARAERWWFLTGTRTGIQDLVTRQLLLVLQEKAPEERESETDLFLHSTRFVLVDGEGRLRGIYDGDEPASRPRILADLERLRRQSAR
jgi:protein SCO1/2